MRWLPIIGILIIIVTIIIFIVDGIRSAIRTSRKRKELLKSGSVPSGIPAHGSVNHKIRAGTDSAKTESSDVSSVLSRFGKDKKV